MNKARMEAFTDGVFAIVVTLLVLDFQLPVGTTTSNLGNGLRHILPVLGTYALSYTIVGLYWIFHHTVSHTVKSVDTRIMWMNIIHIMFIGLIPFTTSVLGKFTFIPWAIAIYGINILLINLTGWFITFYLYRHQGLLVEKLGRSAFAAQNRQYIKIALLYAIGIAIAFILPEISIYIYGFVTLYLILGTLFPRITWRRHIDNTQTT